MKKSVIFFAVIMLSAFVVKAQSADPELDYIRKAYSRDKKEIVQEFLKLTTEEFGKFSQVYEAFEQDRRALAEKRIALIAEYVDNLNKITPELADKIAGEVLANNVSLDKLNLKYYGKMKKVMGAVNAAKFFQLETYFQTTWRTVVQDNIPLIGDIDKQQKH